jgi:hypothetical protein
MKNQVLFILATALVLGLGTSCRRAAAFELLKDPPTHATTVLYDITDPMESRPDATSIVNRFGFDDKDKYDGFRLRIRRLSDVHLTAVYDTSLPAQNSLMGDDMKRVAAVKGFRKRALTLVDSLGREKIGDKRHSVLYRTIAEELNHLADVSASSKLCIIYSDLAENSGEANFYDPSTRAKLRQDPLAIARQLEKVVPLKDLKGIVVVVIYTPSSYEEEQRFNDIFPLYKMMLESKGASISAEANLTTQ